MAGIRAKEEIAEESGLNCSTTLEPENNSIIKKWASVGITPSDAYESQALLQLRKEYCDMQQMR